MGTNNKKKTTKPKVPRVCVCVWPVRDTPFFVFWGRNAGRIAFVAQKCCQTRGTNCLQIFCCLFCFFVFCVSGPARWKKNLQKQEQREERSIIRKKKNQKKKKKYYSSCCRPLFFFFCVFVSVPRKNKKKKEKKEEKKNILRGRGRTRRKNEKEEE